MRAECELAMDETRGCRRTVSACTPYVYVCVAKGFSRAEFFCRSFYVPRTPTTINEAEPTENHTINFSCSIWHIAVILVGLSAYIQLIEPNARLTGFCVRTICCFFLFVYFKYIFGIYSVFVCVSALLPIAIVVIL